MISIVKYHPNFIYSYKENTAAIVQSATKLNNMAKGAINLSNSKFIQQNLMGARWQCLNGFFSSVFFCVITMCGSSYRQRNWPVVLSRCKATGSEFKWSYLVGSEPITALRVPCLRVKRINNVYLLHRFV